MTKATDKTADTSTDTSNTEAETAQLAESSPEAETAKAAADRQRAAGQRHAKVAGVPASEVDGSTIDARPASETNDPRYQDTGLDRDGATAQAGMAASDFNANRDLDPDA